mgnify:CR=1 FL=1
MEIHAIGRVEKNGDRTFLIVDGEYTDGLLGIEGFSHIIVIYWLNENDEPEKRRTLQVHPRHDFSNPLTGVFATRSPLRPNPLALVTCKLLSVEGNRLEIDRIDAFDGSPVIDIKCYTGQDVAKSEPSYPEWL